MGTCDQISAILTKEWIYWRRNMCSSICQLIIPFVGAALLLLISSASYHTDGGPNYETKLAGIDLTNTELTMGGLPNMAVLFKEMFSKATGKAVGVSPASADITKRMMEYFNENGVSALAFESEADLISYAASPINKTEDGTFVNLTCGLSFTKTGENKEYAYKLLIDKYTIQDVSDNFVDTLQRTALADSYYSLVGTSGVFYLKTVADTCILRKEVNNNTARINYALAPMMYDGYDSDLTGNFLGYVIGFFFLISVIWPMIRLIDKFMSDKTSRMRETMKLVGINDSTYFLSYFIFYAIQQFIVSFAMTAVLKSKVFPNSNYFLIASFFFIFGLSIYPFVIILCAIFQKSFVPKIVGFMFIYFSSTVPLPFISAYMASVKSKILVSLMPQVAFFLGLEVFTRSETAGFGVNFSNVGEVHSYGYSVSYAYGFYALDLVIYLLIGLYLDNVLPSPGGVRKSWYYFAQSSYWCPHAVRPVENGEQYHRLTGDEEGKDKDLDLDSSESKPAAGNFEAVDPTLASQEAQQRTVRVKNLRKIFGTNHPAVDGLDLSMYTGQVFVLLGHNGAGKTTTISMMTGMLRATEGEARAFGMDMFQDLTLLRKDLGVCTQHDAFFDQLTVAEHIEMYGKIKGLTSGEIEQSKEKLLRDFKLNYEAKTAVRCLSGGNKRKLSVVLAFIGDPRFVMLDEPTSGMDTTMRRELWDVLAGYKRDRIVLLTTHYMDEADTLGDRIGIMVSGKLVCCGSSMFLKKRYGIGYNLSIIKESPAADSGAIIEFVKSKIDNVQTGMVENEEIELLLPFTESGKFKGMFDGMDLKRQELSIKSYGISITTLEDVFIKVGELGSKAAQAWSKEKKELGSDSSSSEHTKDKEVYSLETNSRLSVLEQFWAVVVKKLREQLRNSSSLLLSILLPLILMWMGLAVFKATLDTREHTYSIRDDFPDTPMIFNNETLVTTNTTMQPIELMEGFAESTGAKLVYTPVSHASDTLHTVTDFAAYLNENRVPSEPYRYASCLIYDADKASNVYSLITLTNVTCPQSVVAFTSELASQVLNKVAGTKISTTISQMSVFNIYLQYANSFSQVYSFTEFFALGLGLIPGLIASYMVHEYEQELKTHLLLAGLPLSVYWFAYYLVDVFFFYIPVLAVIALYNIMSVTVLSVVLTFSRSCHTHGSSW